MFRNATLGKRIGFGFAILSVLTIVVGVAGYLGLAHVLEGTEFYKNTSLINNEVQAAKADVSEYFLYDYDEGRENQKIAQERAFNRIETVQELVRGILESSSLDRSERNQIGTVEKKIAEYRDSLNRYVAAETHKINITRQVHNLNPELSELLKKGELWVDQMLTAHGMVVAQVSTYLDRSLETKWQELDAGMKGFVNAVDDWLSKVENSDELREIGVEIKKMAADLSAMLGQHHQEVAKQTTYKANMSEQLKTIENICTALGEQSGRKLHSQARFSLIMIGVVIGVVLVIAVLYSVLTIRTIVGRTRMIADGVNDGTDQIVSASGQVASASQALAEAAAQQASSIEETSSSLEEMASMTGRNLEHSKEAMSLVGTSTEKLKEANGVMKSLIQSMENTSAASDDVAKIIKTIDEIAFQTNLLALNAAVEAARAGEAGAGFSVVAEEVRNLAMRSSEASLNTQELIMDVIKKIKEGTGLVERTDVCYREVAVNVQKVNDLMNEIVGASQEQAQGIEEINRATAEMDKVTQQNASNAEESASASEEMNAQAQQMKDVVAGLLALVGGTHGNRERKGRNSSEGRAAAKKMAYSEVRASLPTPRVKSGSAGNASHGRPAITPETILPMREEDFSDF